MFAARAMAPLVRCTSRIAPLVSVFSSAMRKVGVVSRAWAVVCRFSIATQAAKVGYLMPIAQRSLE